MLDDNLQSFILFVLSVGGAYTTTLVTFTNLRAQVQANQEEMKEMKDQTTERTKLLHAIEKSVIRIEEKLNSFADAHARNKAEIEEIKKKLSR